MYCVLFINLKGKSSGIFLFSCSFDVMFGSSSAVFRGNRSGGEVKQFVIHWAHTVMLVGLSLALTGWIQCRKIPCLQSLYFVFSPKWDSMAGIHKEIVNSSHP